MEASGQYPVIEHPWSAAGIAVGVVARHPAVTELREALAQWDADGIVGHTPTFDAARRLLAVLDGDSV
jgi:hypothetical protein